MTPRQAIAKLRATPRGKLEWVLERTDLDHVVEAIAGTALTAPFRRDTRRELLDLLCRERVDELSPAMRARIVHALRGLPPGLATSAGIRELLVSLTGDAFRDMKYLLNGSGDSHDLEHVVYEHLTPADRDAVLDHIAREAQAATSDDLRILCDIDDTLKAMLHDRRYPRGTVYPGVVELLKALDDGRAKSPSRPGDLTFVTARPQGPYGLIEQYTRNSLGHLGLPPHAVLGGSFLNIFTKNSIKQRKLQNFERDRALFPECRFMFLGDSGQADPQVGAGMLERGKQAGVTVLIHEVVPVRGAERAELEAVGVRFHRGYDEAARISHELGLIDSAEVERVEAAVAAGPKPRAASPRRA